MSTSEKKQQPPTSVLLNASIRALGIYKRSEPPNETEDGYQLGWFTSPLSKSKTALGTHAQKPIVDALKAILTLDPPGQTTSPWFFRLHKSLPIWLLATELPNAGPLEFDVVAQVPSPANPTAFAAVDVPNLAVRARLVKLVAGGQTVAALQDPVELGLALRLATRPDPVPENTSNLPLLAGFGLRLAMKDPHELTLELTDSSFLTTSNPKTSSEQAATRSVVWKTNDSPVLPLVHTTLLVLRAWVVKLCKTNPEPHIAWRLHKHLFPLLEGTKGPQNQEVLPAFPIQALKGDLSALKPWLSKFLNPNAVITAIYHLRGLLTGKDSWGTAPGSAIAWFSAPPNVDQNDYHHEPPQPYDLGLVVRTDGNVNMGNASLGLRGQACWDVGDPTTRVGMAIEGELLRAAWEGLGSFDPDNPTTVTLPIGAKCNVTAGELALFVVLEVVDPTNPNASLVTVAPFGALKRVEVGARWQNGAMTTFVRVTTTGNVVQSLAQASQQAVDTLNALSSMVPVDVRNAIVNSDAPSLLNAVINWAKGHLGNATIDLGGFATLGFSANDNAVTLGVNDNAFGGPVRLANTSFNVSSSGVSMTMGVQAAPELGLPAPLSLQWTLSDGTPELAVHYDSIPFSLLNPSVTINQIAKDVLRPMVAGLANDVLNQEISSGFTIGDLLNLVGLQQSGWAPPSPEVVVNQILTTFNIATPVNGSSPPKFNLTSNLGFSDGDVRLNVGAIKLGIFDNGAIKPTLEIENVVLEANSELGKPLYANDWFSVGKLGMGVSVGVAELKHIALQVHDVRLPLGSAGSSGSAGLLSTGKDNPGLGIELRYENGLSAKFLDGSQKIQVAIDRVIGPIDVQRMRASLAGQGEATTASITFDAEFKLGGVRIAPQGLGVSIPLKHVAEPNQWSATLEGLALSFRASGINLSGMLAKTDTGFVGQAALDAFGFQLGALAAYDKVAPDDVASLVVFGVLDAMLGGPPFFVVTGVAAGFGVNRAFDRPKRTADLKNNPLLVTMQGGAMDLASFRSSLAPKPGAYWLAAGVRFVSYGFIKGNALLYVLFDGGFELGLIALAKMEIPSLVLVQLAIEAGLSTREEPTLYAKAALYDSWLLHEDCQLTGGFALQVWPGLGDAVITLGGYHPRFVKPDRYPEVDRIGFRWSLGSAISIKGSCYFAMTPREAMGGGRLEVEGTWGPLSAGFHAAVDGLIQWDPFYFDVMIDVGVWIAIDTWLGKLRLSLGVGLHVHGPPIGGTATIDIAVISIDIPFGDQSSPKTAALPVAKVLRDHLQVALPAGTAENAGVVRWNALDLLASDAKAPLRVSVAWGQVGKSQEQSSAPRKLQLASEFKLRIESAVPLTAIRFASDDVPLRDPNDPLYLTLAKQQIRRAALMFNREGSWQQGDFEGVFGERPMALFGPWESAGAANSDMTCEVTAEVIWNMSAMLSTACEVTQLNPEFSNADELCPLPLARAESANFAQQSALLGGGGTWELASLQAVAPALAAELNSMGRPLPRKNVPLSMLAAVEPAAFYRHMSHPWKRPRVTHAAEAPPQLLELAYMELPAAPVTWSGATGVAPEHAAVPRVTLPVSIPRSPLLAGVELHVVTPRTRNVTVGATPLAPATMFTVEGTEPRSACVPAGPVRRKQLVIDHAAFGGLGGHIHEADLRTGEVCVLDVAPKGARKTASWRLLASGGQSLRVVALNAVDQVVDDVDVASGEQAYHLPPGSRRLALLGLGVNPGAPHAIGFGPGTTLVGIGTRTFVGPGCVVVASEGPIPQRTPLGSGPAAKLLEHVTRVDVHLRAAGGIVGVHVQALRNDAPIGALECLVNGEQVAPQSAAVRGNSMVLSIAAPPLAVSVSVRVPDGVRIVGISRWPGQSALPTNVFDVAIHHAVRPRADATRFRLEVMT